MGEEKVTILIQVGVTHSGAVAVRGNFKDKKLCLNLLAEAIKVVANFEEARIVKPNLIKGRLGAVTNAVKE